MIAKLTSRVFFNASPSQLSNASRLRAKFPSSARGGPVILCPPSEPNTAYPRASGDVAPSVVARCPVTSGMNPSNPPPPRRRARLFHEMGRASPNSMSQAAGSTGAILPRMKQKVALPGPTTPAGTIQALVIAAPLVGRPICSTDTFMPASAVQLSTVRTDIVEETHPLDDFLRSEEHTSELQSLMRISYAVFCLKKKKHQIHIHNTKNN